MFDINTSTDDAPIWLQIEEGMRRMIAVGTLKAGDAVPSVRDLARALRVNPNTVARAYQRLTERGVFSVRRGEGTFVAADPTQPKKSERQQKLREAADRYAGAALSLGASLDEALKEIEASYERQTRQLRSKS